MSKEFTLPDLGEGIAEAQIVRVMVHAGDQVAEDQYLMEVETDKAAVEIPSPYSGVATSVHVQEGQTVNVGDVIVTFSDDGAGSASTTSAAPVAATENKPTKPAKSAAPSPSPSLPAARRTTAAAAPAVRKLAREMGIDLDSVVGTGPGGRVTKKDVEHHTGGAGAAAVPSGASSTAPRPRVGSVRASQSVALPEGQDGSDNWGEVRRVPLTQIRKTIAKRMALSAFTAVHVTHGDEADITKLEETRRSLNEATGGDPKLTVLTFVIRATCMALRQHPDFNASFDMDKGETIYKRYVNMGIAVDSDRGLVVPVIRHADQLSMRGIAHALRGIADQIRTNQFAIEDLRGGTFTITNVGALGGTFSTPIINYPEVAILGLGRSRTVPVLRDGQLAESLVLPLNLSFDHRATDGANAARFTSEIKSYLEMPAKFLLD